MNQPTITESSRRARHNEDPIRLGISSCLLGAEVRYDGGHKRDRYLTEVLGEWIEWVPVCPEVEIGLGVPRPTIQLEHGDPEPQLIEPISGEELTGRMKTYASEKVDQLEELGLDGFVLKSRSPSCGIEGVKVFGKNELLARNGTGVFARVLIRLWPDLPVAEEDWLDDPDRRIGFFERILQNHRQRVVGTRSLDAAHRALLERLRVKS